MSKNSDKKLLQNKNSFNEKLDKHYILISLILIAVIGCIIRLNYLPFEIPLTLDAIGYFNYATDMVILDKFPTGYPWPNNGWSTLLFIFFNFYPSTNYLDFMNIQRIIAVCFSVLTIIPVYYLCKKFFNEKISIIGASIFVFEPRIIQNSILGITEALFIFLGTLAISLFLSDNKKMIYLSFMIAGLFALVRYEGLVLIIPLVIIFAVRFRKENKFYFKIIFVILIFILSLLPMAQIRIETLGNDGLVNHISQGPVYYQNIAESNQDENIIFKMIFKGFYNYGMYFVWITIPIFFLLLPYGFGQMIKNRDAKKWMLILSGIILSSAALYVYSRDIQDTRYLYILYPLMCVVSLYTIKPILKKFENKKLVSSIIIMGLIITSVTFLEIKSDTQHERESYEIAKIIAQNAEGVNEYYPESKFLLSIKIHEREFPSLSNSQNDGINIISTSKYETLEEFILNNEQYGLTHLIIDDNLKRQEFLKDIILNENNFLYLEKELDSKDLGFEYQVKIYKINYEMFNSIIKQQINEEK